MLFNNNFILISIILFHFSILVSSQLSSFITSREAKDFIQLAREELNNPTSLRNSYYATKLYESFNIKPYDCYCEKLIHNDNNNNNDNIIDIFYKSRIYQSCACMIEYEIINKDINRIINDLKSNEFMKLVDAGFVVSLGNSIKGVELIDFNFDEFFEKINNYLDDNGNYKYASSTISSLEISSLVIEMLYSFITTITNSESDTVIFGKNLIYLKEFKLLINKLSLKFELLLPRATEFNEFEKYPNDPTLLYYIMNIFEEIPSSLLIRTNIILENMLPLRYSKDLKILSNFIFSLDIITKVNVLDTPINVVLDKKIINTNDDKDFYVSVVNSRGNKIKNIKRILIKSIIKSGSQNYESIHQGAVNKNGKFSLLDSYISPGMYMVNLIVTVFDDVTDEEKDIQVKTTFIVMTDIKVSNVQIGNVLSRVENISSEESMKLLYFAKNDDIHILFSINMVNSNLNNYLIVSKKEFNNPHQVMVKFIHQNTNNSILINVPFSANVVNIVNNELKYHLTLSLVDTSILFSYRNGLYNISVLIADYYYSPVVWKLGVVFLDLQEKPIIHLPIYTNSLLHDSDVTLEALKEIIHINKPNEERAGPFISILFTLFVMVPTILFLIYIIIYLKPTIKLYSNSIVIFITLIGLLLFLFVFYWFSISGFTLYYILKYLIILIPIILIASIYAIKDMKINRLKLESENSNEKND